MLVVDSPFQTWSGTVEISVVYHLLKISEYKEVRLF